jgi:hypothetical protein
MLVCEVLAALVTALVLHNALAHPRRDDKSRHVDAQAGEIKRDILAVEGLLSVGEAATSGDVFGRRDVVRKATALVKGKDEKGRVPLRGGTQSLVDTLDKALTKADRRR